MAISVLKQKRNELNTFFQEWFQLVIPGVNTYYAGQNAPRPELPYVVYQPIAEIDTIGVDETRVDSEGNSYLRGQRRITCEVFAVTSSESRWDGTDDAWSILQELRFSFEYPDVYHKLQAITCRVIEQGNVSDVSENLNTTNESRANLSFTLSTVIVQPFDSGEIRTVNAQGSIETPAGDIHTLDISASKP